MAAWLTADDYKAWARITDTSDDAAISQSVAAVKAQCERRCGFVFDPATGEPLAPDGSVPEDLTEGALLWVNRLQSRRNSPDGVVGVQDLGVTAILRTDADVRAMIGGFLSTVLA